MLIFPGLPYFRRSTYSLQHIPRLCEFLKALQVYHIRWFVHFWMMNERLSENIRVIGSRSINEAQQAGSVFINRHPRRRKRILPGHLGETLIILHFSCSVAWFVQGLFEKKKLENRKNIPCKIILLLSLREHDQIWLQGCLDLAKHNVGSMSPDRDYSCRRIRVDYWQLLHIRLCGDNWGIWSRELAWQLLFNIITYLTWWACPGHAACFSRKSRYSCRR